MSIAAYAAAIDFLTPHEAECHAYYARGAIEGAKLMSLAQGVPEAQAIAMKKLRDASEVADANAARKAREDA